MEAPAKGPESAPAHSSPPHRMPRACGAIGGYDRDRVLAIGAAIGAEMRIAHEGDGSILMLDREPLRWRGGPGARLAWAGPGHLGAPAPASWQDAACKWEANGLFTNAGATTLFTSVTGTLPLYLQRGEGASYFAHAIDPLAISTPGAMEIDWRAWAAILSLGYPIAGRTPFAGISRLDPYSLVTHGPAGPSIEEQRWPWAEIDATLSASQGAPAVVEAMREEFRRLGDGPIRCPVSGGYDSRLVLALIAERGLSDVTACTVPEEMRLEAVEETVTGVCGMLGVPHTMIDVQASEYWDDQHRRYLANDFQRVQHPWLGPVLVRHLEAGRGLVLDGLGGNVQFQPGAGYLGRQLLESEGSYWRAMFWRKMKKKGPLRMLRNDLWPLLRGAARSDWLEIADRYDGHPNAASLTFYRTRTLRAIAMRPYGSLAEIAPVATPIMRDGVARATLAVDPHDKLEDQLYNESFALIDKRLGELETSNAAARVRVRTPRLEQPESLRGYRDLLGDGPLAPHLSRAARLWLGDGDDATALLRSGFKEGMEAIAMFHAWHRRYRDRLGEIDVAADLGLDAT